jgi:regulator of nucleoside diphosphate kinase
MSLRVRTPGACVYRFPIDFVREAFPMRDVVRSRSVPQIIVSKADYERLTDLANASMQRLPDVADELLAEMDRARIVEEGDVPADVVRMGSTVTFKSDDGRIRTMTLVYPADESLDQHRISVMTPIGAALIGLGVGQSISWPGRDGRQHQLTVTEVAAAAKAT